MPTGKSTITITQIEVLEYYPVAIGSKHWGIGYDLRMKIGDREAEITKCLCVDDDEEQAVWSYDSEGECKMMVKVLNGKRHKIAKQAEAEQ